MIRRTLFKDATVHYFPVKVSKGIKSIGFLFKLKKKYQKHSKMKLVTVLLLCLVVVLTAYGQRQIPSWTGKKCGMESQKLYDRSLGLDTCNDYCTSSYASFADSGRCELNASGYGECYCKFQPMIG